MKKLFSISIALILIVSCFVVSAHASSLKYTVRIEGITESLYWSDWDISSDDNEPIEKTVADVLQGISDDTDNTVTITGAKDGFITAVNDEKNGKFGGYDGWMYSVNGKVPEVAVTDYKVENGDSIVLFYGDYPCQVPVLDTSALNEGKIKVQSWDGTYSQDDAGNWVSSYDWAPVVGATLKINNDSYITDENGIADFSKKSYSGKYYIQIDKRSDKGAPQVCRFDSGYQLDIDYKASSDVEPTTAPATEATTVKPVEPVEKKTSISGLSNKSIYVAQSVSVNAKIDNPVGKTTYKSSSKSVSVNSNGKITGKKKGTAVISVINNNVTKTFKVTVKNPKLNRKSVSLKKIGHTFKIKITGKYGKQTYTSSKKAVAKVSKRGIITAKKKGKAVITVKTNGSVKLKIKVTVK